MVTEVTSYFVGSLCLSWGMVFFQLTWPFVHQGVSVLLTSVARTYCCDMVWPAPEQQKFVGLGDRAWYWGC